jgi:DNA-binding MarR family transcriptional regulator
MPTQSPRNDATHALAVEMRVVLGKLARRLRKQGHTDQLTSAQTSVLIQLEQLGCATVTALAHAEGVRPQSMGATVASLEALGLVAGAPDPADGRQTLWTLTPACYELVRASRAAREDWLDRALRERLDEREQARLAAAMPLLRRLLDASTEPRVP